MMLMSGELSTDVARAGQRIKSKVLVALVLSSVVPILVLAFVVLVLVLPTLGPGETLKFGVLQMLIIFTVIGMLAGAWVIWDLGRILARMTADFGGATALDDISAKAFAEWPGRPCGSGPSAWNLALDAIWSAAEYCPSAHRSARP